MITTSSNDSKMEDQFQMTKNILKLIINYFSKCLKYELVWISDTKCIAKTEFTTNSQSVVNVRFHLLSPFVCAPQQLPKFNVFGCFYCFGCLYCFGYLLVFWAALAVFDAFGVFASPFAKPN